MRRNGLGFLDLFPLYIVVVFSHHRAGWVRIVNASLLVTITVHDHDRKRAVRGE